MKFSELGLHNTICENLKKAGIDQPTFIQEESIPVALEGKDVLVESATGSGKTIAFGVPLLEHLAQKGGRALVMAPTRELAEQIFGELKWLGKNLKLKFAVVYGGVGYQKQIAEMQKADVIIATPGRLLDHMQNGQIDLKSVSFFVLDEADRMLDMGFLPDIKRILSTIPKEKQFLCYSATYLPQIKDLTKKMMDNPVFIKGEEMVDPRKLKQFYYDVNGRDKISLLAHLLQEEESTAMIFCNSRRMVDDVVRALATVKVRSVAIHGGLTQQKRKKVLGDFDTKKAPILVCTDVAARGLDINDVTHVYNFDIPDDSKQYIHRIGRTARAGKEGFAINLLAPRDHENFDRIIRFENVTVDFIETPKFDKIELPQQSRAPSRGGFGGGSRGGSRDGPRGGGGASRRSGGRPRSMNRDGSGNSRSDDGPRRTSSGGSRGGFGGDRDSPPPRRDGRSESKGGLHPRDRSSSSSRDARKDRRSGDRDSASRPKRGTRDDLKARGSRGNKTIHKPTNPRGRSSDRRSGPRRVRE